MSTNGIQEDASSDIVREDSTGESPAKRPRLESDHSNEGLEPKEAQKKELHHSDEKLNDNSQTDEQAPNQLLKNDGEANDNINQESGGDGTDSTQQGSIGHIKSLQRSDTMEYTLEEETDKNLDEKTTDITTSTDNETKLTETDQQTSESRDEGTQNGTDLQKIPSLTKIPSVRRDAELIAGIVDGVDITMIYEKLKENRGNPNRVDLVTNEILETIGQVMVRPQLTGSAATQPRPTPASFMEDFVSVIDKTMANLSALPMTADEIHRLLAEEGDREDRVDRVVSKLLTKHYGTLLTCRGDLMEDVQKVTQKMPGANPNEVFSLLQERRDEENRVELVINFLQNRTVARMTRADSLPDDPALRNDPLYRDMRIVAKVLPDMDPNEIYAFLEAHHDQKNRIQLVIEEMMKILPTSTPSLGSDSASITSSLDSSDNVGVKIAYNIGDEVEELREIFPDCDPTYLYNELEKRQEEGDRVRNLAWSMFENKDYPKHDEVLKENEKLTKKERIENMKFNLKDFVSKFPKANETFADTKKGMGDNYKQHVQVQIWNDFKELEKDYLTHIMEKNNFHYTPSKKEIMETVESELSRKYKIDPRQGQEAFPDEPDEYFFYEKMYLAHEDEIIAHLDEEDIIQHLKKYQAKENGELLECGCCYDDECLFEDMAACADGHLFCKDCVKRSSEVIIGDGKYDFPCLADSCDYKFPLPVLQQVMAPNMFSILSRKMQEEEIKQADIPDLVSCPFCSFATIMSNPHDKIFKCLNPECLKNSCRMCREPDHRPLRCDEIEKQGERSMRTYIETCVSEAMLRQCPYCQKRFYKEYGCNKMTCTCGRSMCYLCHKTDVDYNHFDDDNDDMCSLYANVREIHIKEMTDAANEARLKFISEHPDATDIILKYDPEKHIEEMKKLFEDDKDYDYKGGDDDDYDGSGSERELSSDSEDSWRDDDEDEEEEEEEEEEDEEEEEEEEDEVKEEEKEDEEKEEEKEDEEKKEEEEEEKEGKEKKEEEEEEKEEEEDEEKKEEKDDKEKDEEKEDEEKEDKEKDEEKEDEEKDDKEKDEEKEDKEKEQEEED